MIRCKLLFVLLFCAFFGNAFAQDCPRIYRSGDTLKTDPAGGYQWFLNGNPIPNATNQSFLAKDKGNYTVEVSGTSYPFPVIFGKNELIGRVFDHKYEPVAGAKITLIDQTTVTDAQGKFRFASVSNLLPTAVLTATKENYWKNVQRVTFFKNSPTFVNLMLDTLLVTSRIDAKAGAYISNRGFTLQIPPNGVVTADGQTYQGTINLSLKRGFPSEENFGYRMPGGDFSAIDQNGQEKILISYGFMSAEMHGDNGEELKLAPEAEATLEFYTSFAGNKVNPDSMPLWHFDETHALWFPEGIARKVGPRYVGTVKHFSSWNCDLPEDRATVTGTVVNCKGNPIPGIPVTVGQRKVTCNAGGTYESFVPAWIGFDVTENGIDLLHVLPLRVSEVKKLSSLNNGSNMRGIFGLVNEEGKLIIAGQGIVEFSVDEGQTYHSKTDTVVVGLMPVLTQGIAKDSDNCLKKFPILYHNKNGDCQLFESTLLSQIPVYKSLDEALVANSSVVKVNLYNTPMGGDTSVLELMTEVFPCMQEMGISFCRFTNVPTSIGNWTNLQYAYMGGNELTSLPSSVGNWTNLKSISLDANRLTILPESIGNWTNINMVGLELNQLTSLPESVGSWVNLQHIRLFYNNLVTLPESIGSWTKLETLLLYGNQITMLPESIGNLINLRKLDLRNNQLTYLPQSVENLVNLSELDLMNNPIRYPFNHLGRLTNLRILNLANAHRVTYPSFVENLTNLQSLNLSDNGLGTLPASVGIFRNLQILFLNNNQFKILPEEIGNWENLQFLELRGNILTSLPESIGNWINLESLELSNNQLTTLPATIANLKDNLKTLTLWGNNFSPEERVKIQSWLPNTTIYW